MTAIHATHILFDLDGTIVDNFKALHKTYVYVHEKLNLSPPSYETVLQSIGGSTPVTMKKLVGEQNIDEALELFHSHFPTVMFDGVQTLPGTSWLLETLHAQGKQLAVFTNKTGKAARAICQHLGINAWFERIVGSDDTPWRKPEKAFSDYILDQLSAQPEHTILIGDSPFDIEAAAVVGMPCYTVATGSHTIEQLQASNPPPRGAYPDLYTLGETIFKLPKSA